MQDEDRETYDNLILLCPNHHSEVDKNPGPWPIERLRETKAEHERWVSERLQAGQIAVQPVDNSAFLDARRQEWTVLARGRVAIVVSLSPLRALMETLDPLDAKIVQLVDSARIPNGDRTGVGVNLYRTRPTASGIANEDFRDNGSGFGHRIEVFRVGHCEYFCELERSVGQMTEWAQSARIPGQIIRYTDVAKTVELGLSWLWTVWQSVLPYTYVTLTVRVINTANTTLYSCEVFGSRPLLGFRTTAANLEYSEIVERGTSVGDAVSNALDRVVQSYGLVLSGVHDEGGKYVRPERMR